MKLNLIKKGTFLHSSGTTGVNVILFGANMSSSVHAKNKTKDVLIPGEGFTQGLEDIRLYGEKMYSVNFTVARKLCLSLHYNVIMETKLNLIALPKMNQIRTLTRISHIG